MQALGRGGRSGIPAVNRFSQCVSYSLPAVYGFRQDQLFRWLQFSQRVGYRLVSAFVRARQLKVQLVRQSARQLQFSQCLSQRVSYRFSQCVSQRVGYKFSSCVRYSLPASVWVRQCGGSGLLGVCIRLHSTAYVRIRQHTSAYVSIRQAIGVRSVTLCTCV